MPSDTSLGEAKQGPTLSEHVKEVQAIFPSDATMQDAIGRLTRAGFDRAAISIPKASPQASEATPSAGAENPNTEDDMRQSRTLHSSMAGAVGALAAAGATIATGGAAALALAAAAGAGLVTGGAVSAVHSAVDTAQSDARDHSAQAGKLVLAVNVSSPEDATRAEAAMHEAGASRVERVDRTGAGIS